MVIRDISSCNLIRGPLLNHPVRIALAAAALTLALLPGSAAAATKTVIAGYDGAAGAPKGLSPNAYFRSTVTIHQGDSVKWPFRGFHTVTFLGKDKQPPPFALPDPANPISGMLDAAGAAYWFNDQPRIALNPKAAFPAGGKTYDGSKYTSSGLPQGAKPKPYALTFPKKGTFTYYSVLHPGMAGNVKVVGKRTKVPSAKADAAAAKKQLAAVLKVATKRSKETTKPATVEAGRATSEYSLNRFFPAKTTVPVGTPVTFTMAQQSPAEIHTITFGGAAATKPVEDAFISPAPGATPGPPTLVIDPRAAYPTAAPTGQPISYDGTNHGNGLENAGLLDNAKPTPNPATTQVVFTKPGLYRYICVVHPNMAGTIEATG
jgi:plastocyanin